MNIASIINIFKHACLTHVKTPPLGRWNINNYKETMLKMKYATEDNCGISWYDNKNIIQQNKVLYDDNIYIYI